MAATAAIFHHPDAIESEDTPLAGRRTSGQSFLGGYVRHVEAETLHCFAIRKTHLSQFNDIVRGHGWTGNVGGALASDPAKLAVPGTCFVPGPNLADFAWVRRRVSQKAYSICGITHTVSTKRIMEGLAQGVSAPVETWDAIICTSRAVHSVVAKQLDLVGSYLGRRFQAGRIPQPQLPIIPLGVDTGVFRRDETARSAWRAKLGLGPDDIAVMTMGRRTISEKMHPGPLFIAMQLASKQCGKKLTLLMVGWFQDKHNEQLHRQMAAELAPDVQILFPDGKDAQLRYEVWSAADIFTLPVDNLQETFGLAPIEAMAAGLPVVCSDWNGFRDTVQHGETGVLIPTRMARPGLGRTLAARYEDGTDSYHQYLVSAHQRTAIDVRAMAQAIAKLAANADLRAKMGAAGVARAQTHYDWSAVIPQYQSLWAELAARRITDGASAERAASEPSNPAGADPFLLYSQYPSAVMSDDTRLLARQAVTQPQIDRLADISGATHFKRMVARGAEIAHIQNMVFEAGGLSFADVVKQAPNPPGMVEAIVLWLLKFGLLEVAA